jgi:divalent metal cation (Fe/Co/Zn/Cd) transporter
LWDVFRFSLPLPCGSPRGEEPDADGTPAEKRRGDDDMSAQVDIERTDLVRRALVLEGLTLAWVLIEAGVAIWAGSQARSLSLIAFGADSLIEAVSACVLLWRLNVELRHGHAFSEDAERKASKIGGVLLFALAVYVVVSAAWGLWTREGQEFSRLGLVITAATIPIMYLLAKRKLAVAEKIGSRALRTDAMESITCGWLSFVVLVGLVVQLVLGVWWVDSITSLVIVYFRVKEGREAWAVEECGCSSRH